MSENYLSPPEGEQLASRLGAAVKRRKLLILLCVAGAVVPVIGLNQFSHPVYEASTVLVFEEAPSPIPFVPVLDSQGGGLFNHLEEIQSLSFAAEVARSLPEELRQRLESPVESAEEQLAGPDSLSVAAVKISQAISAEPVRKSNLIRIRIRMGDPELCMTVANTAARVLQERNLRVKQQGVQGVRTFVENQVIRFAKSLEQSEMALRHFKQTNGITAFDAESQEVLKRLTEAEILYNAAKTNRQAAEERLVAVESTVDEQRRQLAPSMTAITTPSVQRLKEKLVTLQLQYTDFTVQNYPADHPKLVALRQEIEETKKTLTLEAHKLAQGNNVGGDPLAQIEKFVNESLSLQIEIESLRAQESGLHRTIQDYQGQLRSLPAMEFELARLMREREVNQKIYVTLLEKLEESKISEAEQLPSIRVIDTAHLPERPIAPRKGLNLTLGLGAGLVLGLGLALLLEMMRGSVDMTQDLEKVTGWPVLAWVPRTAFARRRRIARPGSAAAEAFDILKTQVEQYGVGTRYRSLMVTSLGPGDGKSTALANLAVAFANAGAKTVLVDAELRRPTVHTVFNIPMVPGLAEIMTNGNGDQAPSGAVPIRRPVYTGASGAVIGSRLGVRPDVSSAAAVASPPREGEQVSFRRGIVPNLTVVTCGRRIDKNRELLTATAVRAFLDRLTADYDVVLVDAAPLLLVHTTTVVAKQVDAVLLVVDATAYDPELIRRIKDLLDRAKVNVIGSVVNKMDLSGVYKGEYYRYYQSH